MIAKQPADSEIAGIRDERFDLDPFRGVLCLWLMGLHLCGMSEGKEPLLRLVGSRIADLAQDFRLGVESFLILAGFMTAHMLRPIRGESIRLWPYFQRRCVRLLLPFWIAVLLAAADRWLAFFLFGGGQARPDLGDLLAQLLLVNELTGAPEPATGYWTIATLEQFYVVWSCSLALLLWCCFRGAEDGCGRRISIWMGVLAFAIFFVSGAIFVLDIPTPLLLPRYAFYLALGVLVYGNSRLGLHRWELRVALVALCAAAIWFQHSRLAAALFSSGLIYLLACGARFPVGTFFLVLRYLGQRAYSVYLVHAVVGIRVMSMYRLVSEWGDWVVVPLLALAASVSIIGAALFYRFVEQPCRVLSQRFVYRTSVPVPAGMSPPHLSRK